MTPAQSKMARAGLGWSLSDLAAASGVSRMTAVRFEGGQSVAPKSVTAIWSAYQAAGVTLIDAGEKSTRGGVGVRLRG
ncbi:helix-turn-helix domain-containing protein [Sphingomonas sp. MG17]|uniref:Helix-turn-helix domain-containing protein n=1 Tax=Sphingomonas tagetis TaxID=2949092 RepID=A0A9X2KPU5_9SPHN|nr:helix-turn-helix domain-containing protein [Sphingomonas tagetis]MCP3731068.1 helix-turn-helix domain-containing protein [Sphingomonas tagetis]